MKPRAHQFELARARWIATKNFGKRTVATHWQRTDTVNKSTAVQAFYNNQQLIAVTTISVKHHQPQQIYIFSYPEMTI